MIDRYYPDTLELIAAQRTRRVWIMIGLLTLTLLVAGVTCAILWFAPGASIVTVLAASLAAILFIAAPVAVWNNPRLGLYVIAVCAIVAGCPNAMETIVVPTSFFPFWMNLGIAVRELTRSTAVQGFPFSLAEILMVITALSWFIREVTNRTLKLELGAFFWPIVAYTGAVMMGAGYGFLTGGDLTIIGWEVRPQFNMLLVYLLAVNLIRTRQNALILLWLNIVSAGYMSICFTISYFYNGGVIPGFQTIMAMDHADTLFMCNLILSAVVLVVSGASRRGSTCSLLMVPTALFALFASTRRAGIAALIVALIPLLPLAWFVFAERRVQVLRIEIVLGLTAAIYFPAAWNSSGTWAFAARAIRSASDPNARDAGSNNYRYMEDEDLKMNRDLHPWIGIGYGKEFAKFIPLPALNDEKLLKYMPHNSVLWVWMRLGHVGFFLFLMMLATIFIRGAQSLRITRDPMLRVIGAIAVIQVLMLYIYGKYDLQWTSPRQVCFAGILIGVLAILPKLDAQHSGAAPEAPETEAAA